MARTAIQPGEVKRKNTRKLKPLPVFKSEDEEREFWATHDSTDYVDWDKAERAVFPNLRPTASGEDPRRTQRPRNRNGSV